VACTHTWHVLWSMHFCVTTTEMQKVRCNLRVKLCDSYPSALSVRLRVPERVTFQLSVLAYRCLHGIAPTYLAESLHRISNVDTRRRLRSADSTMLVVPSTRCSTLGDCPFPVASAHAWNSLPSSIRNALSLTIFRHELKTVLLRSLFDND